MYAEVEFRGSNLAYIGPSALRLVEINGRHRLRKISGI